MNDFSGEGAAGSDHGIERDDFMRAVLAGLDRTQKELPCRFFYDARGSELFEDITRLDEYYPTRTEIAILEAHRDALSSLAGKGAWLVEFGSGSSTKTEILLESMDGLQAYVGIDVSQSALEEARDRMAKRHKGVRLETIVADFSGPVAMPDGYSSATALGFFPGSTIGNQTRSEAQRLLQHFGAMLGPGARLIIGVDLKKDLDVLLPAYNDASGVTAAFNLNLLTRINRELGGDFDEGQFRHDAIWNKQAGRIEMHLVSQRAQQVQVGGRRFLFAAGETIHTENSHKYTVEEFRALALRAGWRSLDLWTDDREMFSVQVLDAVQR